MQDLSVALPRVGPLVFVYVEGGDVGESGEGREGGLFGGCAGEEAGGGGGEDEADGEVGVVGKGEEEGGELDCGYGAGGGEEEVEFGVVEGEGEEVCW